ncbi:hypothetical protein ZIOFF_012130 [Zingiber officinale]|uniref:Transmembrane protein 18 n=1 Tax=Zingiber officinale TaxID=94328 RepID=A0A8J5HRV9_ZINOF|nr:hypothetical protein ZIOFF_012130 [Zingiber officinale]
MVVAELSLVKRAALTCKEKSQIMEKTRATIDAAMKEGIPSYIDLFEELVLPLVAIGKNFNKLRHWEKPHLTVSFLIFVYFIIFSIELNAIAFSPNNSFNSSLHMKVLSYTVFEATTAMEDLKAALNEHVDLVSDLFEKFSAELRSGFGPAVDNFIGFFHAIDWKVCFFNLNNTMHLLHCCLCLVINKRKEVSYNGFGSEELEELCLFGCAGVSGVYLAERVNSFLGKRWQSFSSQNYFDPHGVFISVLWSGPLLVITILIVVNTLFTLCHLMVKWKKAELRHRARVGRDKQE